LKHKQTQTPTARTAKDKPKRPAFADALTVVRPPFFEVATMVSVKPERIAREYEAKLRDSDDDRE